MKTGLIVFVIGLIVSILGGLGLYSSEGLTNGAITLVIGYPLVLIGIIIIIIALFKRKK